jgi:hypothetical protein
LGQQVSVSASVYHAPAYETIARTYVAFALTVFLL